MSSFFEIKVLENHHVSPPPNAVPQAPLPLTYFDIPWLGIPSPTQRIFFYKSCFSTSEFLLSILPKLKQSLSTALQRFYPLAGNLICPPQPNKLHILCKDGDFVPLIVAEARGDFDHLIDNHCLRDVREFDPLVPDLPSSTFSSDGNVEYLPVLALQITFFPESGVCIGITGNHSATDGKGLIHFIKSWASICKSNGDSSCSDECLPLIDRGVIKDPYGMEEINLNHWWASSKMKTELPCTGDINKNRVRSTFLMNRAVIQKLKETIVKPIRPSSFSAVCGFMWVCLVKSQVAAASSDSIPFDEDEPVCFGFVADCRNRFHTSIPEEYFGNCLVPSHITVKRGELLREDGFSAAANLISSCVKQLENGGLEKALRNAMSEYETVTKSYFVSVAGSPKLKVYEKDFGWGKPDKVEVVHLDGSGTFALSESRDEEGGVEIGLALSSDQMKAFTSIFEHGIKDLL